MLLMGIIRALAVTWAWDSRVERPRSGATRIHPQDCSQVVHRQSTVRRREDVLMPGSDCLRKRAQ